MKKIATIALALGLTASTAFAGGYSAPVVEAEPVVVEGSSSSNAGLLIPALLVVGLIAIAASDSSDDTATTGTTTLDEWFALSPRLTRGHQKPESSAFRLFLFCDAVLTRLGTKYTRKMAQPDGRATTGSGSLDPQGRMVCKLTLPISGPIHWRDSKIRPSDDTR